MSSMDGAVREIEYLARSSHRVEVLYAVADHPLRRDELRELTGASSANLSRVLRGFEERHWIVRDGCWYKTTLLGEFVAGEFRGLHEGMKTEQQVRDIWLLLPAEAREFTLGMISEGVVTVAEREDPYRPVNRFVS
jgi:predicted transcriptional regulator